LHTDAGLSQQDIEQGLRAAGLCEGMLVEVHSSLSSLGYVHGGADTVIQALINTVGPDGGIVMPSFLLSPPQELTPLDVARGLTCKIKILSPDHNERSGMGIIADTFRKRADVLTGTGIFRVSAWGKDQEINSQGFQHVIDSGGWGLLLGVDIYRLSAMHYVESELPQEIKSIFQPSDEVREYYPADAWYIETGIPPVKAWYKIQDEAYRRGYIRDTSIGNCKCMSFQVRQVIGLYEEALHTDPLGLYGLR
jgi:aminoglycoside N3'-acetyltransferase